jgi:hypothetical protein
MPVRLNTASGGSVTLDPANTASNFTVTVPAATGTMIYSDTSGNVGIGTSSPTDKLSVDGSGRFYGAYTENSTNIGVLALVTWLAGNGHFK